MEKLKSYETHVVRLYDSQTGEFKELTGDFFKKYDGGFFAIGKSKKDCTLFYYDEATQVLFKGPQNKIGQKCFTEVVTGLSGYFVWKYNGKIFLQRFGEKTVFVLLPSLCLKKRGIFTQCDIVIGDNGKILMAVSATKEGVRVCLFDGAKGEHLLYLECSSVKLYDNALLFQQKKQWSLFSFAEKKFIPLGKRLLDNCYAYAMSGDSYLTCLFCSHGSLFWEGVRCVMFETVCLADGRRVPFYLSDDGLYRFVFRENGYKASSVKISYGEESKIFWRDGKNYAYRKVYEGADRGRFHNAVLISNGEQEKLFRLFSDGHLELFVEGKESFDFCCIHHCCLQIDWDYAIEEHKRHQARTEQRRQEKEKRDRKRAFWRRFFCGLFSK